VTDPRTTKPGRARIDETGNVYGSLTVVRWLEEACRWECQCTCGNMHLSNGSNLRTGKVTQCRACTNRAIGKSMTAYHAQRRGRSA